MSTGFHPTLGFVGTGTITAAMVRGLLSKGGDGGRIIVSPRNADTARALADAHPEVMIASGNQEVIDRADIVVLAVRPQIAADVVPALRFRPGQRVISVIAATDRATLLSWIDDGIDLVQAIPLPFVETCDGVTAIYPPHREVAALFDRLGTTVVCNKVEDYRLLAVASATMSLYFGMMGRMVDWLAAHGLPKDDARAYLSAHFLSLSRVAARDQAVSLDRLVEDYATRGGLNEQVWLDFDRTGGSDAIERALSRVHDRIRGQS